MPRRIFESDGTRWEVSVSGRTTQYGKDEFGVVFRRLGNGGAPVETRLARYSPMGGRNRELSFARMSEAEFRTLLAQSQPSWTAPELGYRR